MVRFWNHPHLWKSSDRPSLSKKAGEGHPCHSLLRPGAASTPSPCTVQAPPEEEASDPQKHPPPLPLAPHPLQLQALFSEP